MANLKLSIVDQSPVHDGKNQAHALNESINLAKLADELGYHRYWVAEHHATPAYASSAPEIVIGQIAASTEKIKVGSGGVMLSHYSPYKVAEVFKTLAAFHPGRIDLGVGRAPGGSESSSIALAYPHNPSPSDHYPHQLEALTAFIDDYKFEKQHPFSDLTTTPMGGSSPELWTLGSSDGSIDLAASMGLGFVLALFIGTHERSADIIKRYRKLYRPRTGSAPQSGSAMIASAVIAADTKEEAEFLAASHTYWKVLAFRHGAREEVKPPETCLDLMKKLSPSDQAYFHETRNSIITGTPNECRARLEKQANYYDVDEVMVVAVTHSFEKRCDSYRKLARVFSE